MSGNMGNMGNMGNLGNAFYTSGSGPSGLPDRVNLPLMEEEASVGIVKGVVAVGAQQLKELPGSPSPTWQPRDWDSHWTAWRVLDEFSLTKWRTITLALWNDAGNANEIKMLIKYAEDERSDALGEIVAQDAFYDHFAIYFMRLLRITTGSHPHTCALLQVAGLVGLMATMHYKANPGGGRAPRVRPNQLIPALMPPVEVPGHPSFPSGHAMQSMFMALLLLEAMPGPKKASLEPLLHTMAVRMGRNREIAGLHYPSDSDAGRDLASQLVPFLLNSADCPVFKEVLDAAKGEW